MSHVEGMYGPPLEAFSSGCTVITNKVTGHEEYIKDGYNGIILDKDREATEKINFLFENRDILNNLKKNAFKTAKNWIAMEQSGVYFEKAMLDIVNNYSIYNSSNDTLKHYNMITNYITKNTKLILKEKSIKSKIKNIIKKLVNKNKYNMKKELTKINIIKKCFNIPGTLRF